MVVFGLPDSCLQTGKDTYKKLFFARAYVSVQKSQLRLISVEH